jgi:hypothetical protein
VSAHTRPPYAAETCKPAASRSPAIRLSQLAWRAERLGTSGHVGANAMRQNWFGWPALTWATGSDYTGYVLTGAAWISGAVWLGVLVVWAVIVVVTS